MNVLDTSFSHGELPRYELSAHSFSVKSTCYLTEKECALSSYLGSLFKNQINIFIVLAESFFSTARLAKL